MREWWRRSRRRGIGASLALVALGIVLWGGFNTAMEATNSLSFCVSCHEMRDNIQPDYVKSSHHANPSGVRAVCADCHVPRDWTAKLVRKVSASRELWHWILGTVNTPERFEAQRLRLARRVWRYMKASDSRECRNCHTFSAMKLNRQGRFAASIHAEAREKGRTCIDCHKGITHQLPRNMPLPEGMENVSTWEDDPEYAEEIMITCAPCHGDRGQGTPDGTYPRLAGLDPVYLARQLRAFKKRQRVNIPMQPYATERELPERDVRIISLHLSRLKLPSRVERPANGAVDAFELLKKARLAVNVPLWRKGDPASGGRLYARECAGCHGERGEGDRIRAIPALTGQYSAYLKRQIAAFANGKRHHDRPRDARVFASFGEREIDDILAWLSAQDD